MVSVKSMEFASFTLGILGIVASLLVLGGPRPGPGVWTGIPSAQTCLQWMLAPAQEQDFPSAMNYLQWLLSVDVGFSDSVNKALRFPDLVLFTSVVHILANVGLLYGVYQSNSCFVAVFILYQMFTWFLFSIFEFLALFNVTPSYESFLVAMCHPMETSVILLYGKYLYLPVLIIVTKFVLFFCTILLLEKMHGIKNKAKPAFVIPV